jgi:three-Cys-motif partner protein
LPDEPIWDLEPHTAAKHELLRRYLGAWFPIMASSGYRGRLLFLDGFAGPGIYKGGQPGSPLIALKTLLEHEQFSKWSHTEFVFAFVEPDPDRYNSLVAQIAGYEETFTNGFPGNVRIHTEQAKFEDVAGEILDSLGKKKLAPTFAFVDPFGFSGAPMELIAQLLSFESCEVFFNFIAEPVTRFLDHPNTKIERHFGELFGSDEFRNGNTLSGEERLAFLHDLYAKQLRETAQFTYVKSFRMIDDRGKTPCWLFYGTRRLKGLEKMKDAMWAVDPGGGIQFSDRLAGQDVLFSRANLDVSTLRAALLDQFSGMEVDIDQIERYVLTETPYGANHYKRRVLGPLEQEKQIEVVSAPDGRKKNSFPKGTVVKFK